MDTHIPCFSSRIAARSRFRIVLLALALACPAAAEPASRDIPDELIVRLKSGMSMARGRGLARGQSAAVLGELPASRLLRLRVPAAARDKVIKALSHRHEVEVVEPNREHAPTLVPADPQYGNAWHLPVIEAPGAWDLTTGSATVSVAILDSGVDLSHPDLQDKLLPGWDFQDNDADPSDVYGHGTKVAGAAAAATDNDVGVSAIGWDTKILPVRIAGADGWTDTWKVASGIDFAVAQGARVVNLSFGGLAGSGAVIAAARDAYEAGTLVVASAGNCGCVEPFADTPYLLSVAATTQSDGLAGFSSQGSYVDLSAPGVSIRTTRDGGTYAYGSGTSYSAPVVSGLAALILAADSSLGPAEVVSVLEQSAIDLGPPGHDDAFGHGRVSAFGAVALVAGGVPACSDGQDNDGNGMVDMADPGCWFHDDLSEGPDCSDGLDNDEDGLTDLSDPACAAGANGASEIEIAACGLGFELALVVPLLVAWRRRRAGHVA